MHVGSAWQETALAVGWPQTLGQPGCESRRQQLPRHWLEGKSRTPRQSPAQLLNADGSDGQVGHCKGGCVEAPAAARWHCRLASRGSRDMSSTRDGLAQRTVQALQGRLRRGASTRQAYTASLHMHGHTGARHAARGRPVDCALRAPQTACQHCTAVAVPLRSGCNPAGGPDDRPHGVVPPRRPAISVQCAAVVCWGLLTC